VRAPDWLDQLKLIKFICDFLPNNYSLLIKEHPAMVGSWSFSEIKKLIDSGRIYLINPIVNSYDLIQKADAVVTINSKVGMEAIMQKKLVFTVGKSFYSASEFCVYCENTSQLKSKIKFFLKNKYKRPKIADTELINLLCSFWQFSLKGELYVNEKYNINNFTRSLILATLKKRYLSDFGWRNEKIN
jgi:capsule polysaccharide export protein KpsC/LpsZ